MFRPAWNVETIMPEQCAAKFSPSRRSRPSLMMSWGVKCFRVADALERWRQRRRLLMLDERMLRDIGISRCDAEREAAKRWQ